MKKIHLRSIHDILSKSINRQGMQVNLIYKQHPHPIANEIFDFLLFNDDMIDMSNKPIIKLKESYYKSDTFIKFEESFYNINYLKTLFKEETNTIKLSIYKLLVDTESLTYQQISNEMIRLYETKLDIKQVSHYCMELVKIKLIVSNQSNTIEKINKINHISIAYKNKDDDKEAQEQIIIRRNINFNQDYCHFPHQILILHQNEVMSENKFFLSNRFSFVIDGYNIKNNILFHLLLNKEKGLTANEICLLCDFTGREKTLNKIISVLETKKLITHTVAREGKKLEFVYKIYENAMIDKNIKYHAEYYRNHSHYSQNNNNILSYSIENKSIMQQAEFILQSNLLLQTNQNNNDSSKPHNKLQFFNEQPSIQLIQNNEYEELNQTDFEYILSLTQRDTNQTYTHKEKCKIILAYLSPSKATINKYFSTSTYNRFIFILNQINDHKVLSLIDIKRLILQILEHNKGFEIDRRTLKRILENLQNLKLIKLMYLDLIMKNLQQSYLNEKKEIVQEKIIALRRDQDENNEVLIKNVSERVKPLKKTIIKKSQPQSKIIRKEIKIQDITIDIQSLSITQYERNIGLFVKKMMKMIKEDNKKYSAMKFIMKMKRIYSIKKNSTMMFDNQEYITEFDGDKMKLYKIYEQIPQRKIIVPQYFLNMIIKDNNLENENEGEYDKLKEYYDFIIKSKSVVKETFQGSISKENEEKVKINEEIKKKEITIPSFLNTKRKRDEYPEIDKNRFDLKKWNKFIDINAILKEIYLLPGITFKKLKKMIHISNDIDGAEAELLQYLQKLHIIVISNTDINDRLITDITSFFVDSNFKLFIDI